MKRAGEIIQTIGASLFLKKHILKPSTEKLLKNLYPSVDWNRVDFYEGLPWYTPFIAPYVTAQALPQFYSFHRFRIYLKKFDESRAQCLADIVHEGFHVMQSMQFLKGYGLGILRGFSIYYTALYTKYGYRRNPFEIPAHEQEYRFLDFCLKNNQHGIVPKLNTAILENITPDTGLVFQTYRVEYEKNIFSLIISTLLCTVIVVLRPILDLLVFVLRLFIPKHKKQSPGSGLRS
jgi:hypothetical protein